MTDLTATPISTSAPRQFVGHGPVQMIALWRQRRALARLSPQQLADIGISAQDAKTEAARPMWDVPCHWVG